MTSTPDVKKIVQVQGFSPEKETALRQFLQRKGLTKVKPDPELSKSSVGVPAKSKELLDSLKITEANTPKIIANTVPKLNPVKQTLQFHEKSDSSANSFSSISSITTKGKKILGLF